MSHCDGLIWLNQPCTSYHQSALFLYSHSHPTSKTNLSRLILQSFLIICVLTVYLIQTNEPNQMWTSTNKHKQAWKHMNECKWKPNEQVRWMVGQVWCAQMCGWMSADKHEQQEKMGRGAGVCVTPVGVVAMMTVVTVAKAAVMVVAAAAMAAPAQASMFTPPASPFFFFWSFLIYSVLVIFMYVLYSINGACKKKEKKPHQPVFYNQISKINK